MGDQMQPNNRNSSDEIDLGQLFLMIRKGFGNLFKAFLGLFLYLRKNAIKLGALVFIGVGVGFLMNNFIPKKLKTEVIVKPNFESKEYLYDVTEEIQANIRSKDTLFFQKLGINVNDLKNFSISVEPVVEEEVDREMADADNKYLEILQNYKENAFIIDVVKTAVLKKSSVTHRITFSHRNPLKGAEYTAKIMEYINSNPYFIAVQDVYRENASSRIAQNKTLIAQIDTLVSNYSKNLSDRKNNEPQGMVFLETENGLNIPTLLSLKNGLIRESENKKVELVEQKDAIRIINFGKTQVVKKPLFGKNLVMAPLLLLGVYFLFTLITFLNRKTDEL